MGGIKEYFTSNSTFEECSYFKTLKTVVRDLGWGTDALVFARGTVGFFTGYNAHHQKMFTHFSHILVDESDNEWVVERTEHSVNFQKITKEEQREMMGSIVDEWCDIYLPFSVVKAFVARQRAMNYSLVAKNCKHFTYDFRRELLHEHRDFYEYCQFIETKFNG